MSSVQVRPFRRDDRDQLTRLVNAHAEAVVPRLRGAYERLYYQGIIWERRGHARAIQGGPGSAAVAYDWIKKAMHFYEQA